MLFHVLTNITVHSASFFGRLSNYITLTVYDYITELWKISKIKALDNKKRNQS